MTEGPGSDPEGGLQRVVGAVALREGRVLMAQRAKGRFEGFWEFPGGKVEDGESDEEALRRELKEELGVEAGVHHLIAVGRDGATELWCYAVDFDGEPLALEHKALRWVPLGELAALRTPPADARTISALTRL